MPRQLLGSCHGIRSALRRDGLAGASSKGESDHVCQELNVRHTRPQHAWTNGFVERPDQGYRTRGRPPAEILWGATRAQCHEEA